jgi:sugar/nucleoside kinase (ribokinase family)
MSACDVYSYGVVASSTLYVFKGDFPVPDGYSEIDDVQYMVGGEAANSSIVLARLGARVKLDGNWLGNDDRGTRTRALLDRSGVDTSRLPLREDYRGVLEVVFAADKTRTIFGGYGRLLEREDWNMPRPEDVRQAKVICLDPFFGKASLRVAEVGCDAGIPVVTIDCLHDDPLLEYASAVVISDNYIQWKYADHRLEDLFQAYLNATDGLVVFTFGEKEVWYGRPGTVIGKKPVARKRSGMADRARSLARSPHIRSMPSTQAPLETPSGPVLCSGSCTDGTTRRRLNLLQRLRVLFVLGFRAR